MTNSRHRNKRRAKRIKRACTEKTVYAGHLVAIREGAKFGLDPYKCPYCKGWHLTDKTTLSNRKER
jgi:hypothetical protein